MRNFDATQLAILASPRKFVKWLFEITLVGSVVPDYYWSLRSCSFGVQDYDFKIMNFSGIPMQFPDVYNDVIPNVKTTINCTFSNSEIDGNYASDFENATILIRCVVGGGDGTLEAEIASWKFVVQTAVSVKQQLSLECQDFFSLYMEGDYPITSLVSSAFPNAYMASDNIVVPKIWGIPYIPLRHITSSIVGIFTDLDTFFVVGDKTSLFASGQAVSCFCGIDGFKGGWVDTSSFLIGSGITIVNLTAASADLTANFQYVNTDHYLLGANNAHTIYEARSPKELVNKVSIFGAGNYTFKQDSVLGEDGPTYKAAQLIAVDANGDGIVDSNIFWNSGATEKYDVPFRYGDDTTITTTSLVDQLVAILEDIGIPSADIDAASVAAAKAIVDTRITTSCLGIFYRQSRKSLICKLCKQMGVVPIIRDKVYLKVLTSTPVATLATDVVVGGNVQITSDHTTTQKYKDCGYVKWQLSTLPQDVVNKGIVPCKASTTYKSDITIECENLPTESIARTSAQLALQRIILKDKAIMFSCFSSQIGLEVGDFLTINDQNYGATASSYVMMITNVKIAQGLLLNIEGNTYRDTIDNWDDITPVDVGAGDIENNNGVSSVYQGPDDVVGLSGTAVNTITSNLKIGQGGKFKTSDDPFTQGGLLLTLDNFQIFDDAGGNVQNNILSGVDIGDLIVGNYAGNNGIKWDKSAGTFYIKGNLTAASGTIGGWDISSTQIYKGGVVLDSANLEIKVATGLNWISMSPAGLAGYDSVLGTTFKILTDGSAPELSSGIIKECEYQIYTSGVIKTSDDPTTGGGFLANNAHVACYADDPLLIFDVLLTGINKGDITIGDYAGGSGLCYDHSVGSFTFKTPSIGGVQITGGGTTTLEGDDTTPAELDFTGFSYNVQFGANAAGTKFLIRPDSDDAIDLEIGSATCFWGTALTRFQDITTNSSQSNAMRAGAFSGAHNGASVRCDGNDASAGPSIVYTLQDKTLSTSSRLYNMFYGSFEPSTIESQDLGSSSNRWANIYGNTLVGLLTTAPLTLTPSSSASAPSHSATIGTIVLTSACVMYANTDGGTTWSKIGGQ